MVWIVCSMIRGKLKGTVEVFKLSLRRHAVE